jgi:hypothetical protein
MLMIEVGQNDCAQQALDGLYTIMDGAKSEDSKSTEYLWERRRKYMNVSQASLILAQKLQMTSKLLNSQD